MYFKFTWQFVVHAVDTAAAPFPTIQYARNDTEPVLQLLVEQHNVAVPAVDEPVLEAVHVVPDGTHVYVLVAVPADQAEEVFYKLEL